MMNLKINRFFFLVFPFLFTTLSAYSQSGAIGVHGTLNEYSGDLNLDNYHFYSFSHPKPGAAISVQQYLNPSFNLVEKFSFNQVRYENAEKLWGLDADLLTLNLKLKYKFNNDYLLKETADIAPFLVAGIGGA